MSSHNCGDWQNAETLGSRADISQWLTPSVGDGEARLCPTTTHYILPSDIEFVVHVGVAVFALSQSVHQPFVSRRSRDKATLRQRRQSAGVGSVSSPASDSSDIGVDVAVSGAGHHQETTTADRTATPGGN